MSRKPIDIETMDVRARQEAASNRNTSPVVLERLAKDRDIAVRFAVAGNPKTPPTALTFLTGDTDVVRVRVAMNPNTPPEVLEKLANVPVDDISNAAKQNLDMRKRARCKIPPC